MADEDDAREDSTSGISAFGLIFGLEIWLIVLNVDSWWKILFLYAPFVCFG